METFGPSQEELNNQKQFNEELSEYRRLIQNIAGELGKQVAQTTQASREYRKLDSIASQLLDRQGDISNLSSDQIKKLKDKAVLNKTLIEDASDRLAKEKGYTDALEDNIAAGLEVGELNEKEAALLRARLDNLSIEQEFIDSINDELVRRIQYEEKINQLTGATGAVLQTTRDVVAGIGGQALTQYLRFDQAKQVMNELADEIARAAQAEDRAVTSAEAFRVKLAGVQEVARGVTEALYSTENVTRFIASSMLKGAENAAKFQQQLGVSRTVSAELNAEMELIAFHSDQAFITSQKLVKSFGELSNEIGFAANTLGGDVLVSFTNLTERLGLNNKEAASLTTQLRLQGESTEDQLENLTGITNEFNQQNKTTFSLKNILRDVSNISKATLLTFGGSTEELAKAALEARNLGTNLATVRKIAASLLDFESSISNELEAQLLSGDRINLSRARALAFADDLAGVAKEVGKQEAIINAFATKNVIAQESIAKSIGLSRDELGDMIYQQELLELGAEGFKQKYTEATYEAYLTRSAQQAFNDTLQKGQSILGSIFRAFGPILNVVNEIANTKLGPYFISAGLAGGYFAKRLGLVDMAFDRLKAKIITTTTAQQGLNAAQEAGSRTGGVGASAISRINTTALLKGAAAMAIAAGGIFVFAKALQEFDKIESWENTAKGLLAFGVSLAATTAILNAFAPVALPASAALAAFGIAVAGVGAGLNLASKGFAIVSDSLTKLEGLNLVQMAGGLVSIAGGITALFSSLALGGLGLGGIVALTAIAALVSPIAKSAESMNMLANSFGKLADNVDRLDTAKLGEIKDALVTNANLPMLAAADAVSGLVANLSAPTTDNSNQELLAEVKAMRAAIEAGGSVYIDSKSAGDAAVLNTFKN